MNIDVRKSKNIVIVMMLLCILTMTAGYAAFSQAIKIQGTAKVGSTWGVKITDISSKAIGGASDKIAPSHTDTTATFNTNLVNPGDKMEYTVTVTNTGTLTAIIDSVKLESNKNEAIIYTVEDIERGYTLTKDESIKFKVTVEYDSNVTTQPENASATATITVNAVQFYGSNIEEVKKPQKYTVTFDPQGGTTSFSSKEVTVGETYGELPVPTKPDNYPANYLYYFWNLKSDCSDSRWIYSNTEVKPDDGHTLYACWWQGYY